MCVCVHVCVYVCVCARVHMCVVGDWSQLNYYYCKLLCFCLGFHLLKSSQHHPQLLFSTKTIRKLNKVPLCRWIESKAAIKFNVDVGMGV